jgi:glutathione S-transferase
MYRLYYSPGAASLAVHWMLIEIGAPFELEHVDFEAREQKSPEYLAINPLGHVPTLIVEGQAYAETAGLLMLLAERHAESGLAPSPGSPGRGTYLQLMLYLANTLMPAFRAWFYPQDFGDAERFDEIKANARARIEAAFDRLDARLSDGRPYFLRENFSTVDILATMLARWARNMPSPADRLPALGPYLDRMRKRPALRGVHEREGLTDWIDLAEVG